MSKPSSTRSRTDPSAQRFDSGGPSPERRRKPKRWQVELRSRTRFGGPRRQEIVSRANSTTAISAPPGSSNRRRERAVFVAPTSWPRGHVAPGALHVLRRVRSAFSSTGSRVEREERGHVVVRGLPALVCACRQHSVTNVMRRGAGPSRLDPLSSKPIARTAALLDRQSSWRPGRRELSARMCHASGRSTHGAGKARGGGEPRDDRGAESSVEHRSVGYALCLDRRAARSVASRRTGVSEGATK